MIKILKMENIQRRDFLKLGGVLAIGFTVPSFLKGSSNLFKMEASALGLELSPYVLITADNKITILCPKPDMGQGTTQSMPMLVAEELGVTMNQIDVKFTSGLEKYGSQGSGGSSSVRTRWKPMREAGAAAKEMLVKAAANRWNLPVEDCFTEGGKIFNTKNKNVLSFGELVDEAAKLDVPKSPKLKSPKDFKLIGKSIPRHDIPAKTNGSAVFGIDVKVPNMVYAAILHSPLIHGKVKSIDDSAALKVNGVKKVLKTERKTLFKTMECVAVIADNTWAAMEGRKALVVDWDNGDFDKISTDKYFSNLRELAKTEGVVEKDKKGDITEGFKVAAKTIEAAYETPFTAHAMLEPENAIAFVQGDKVEIWAPAQGADNCISAVADYLKIPKANVKMNVQLMGGAFGRKSYYDFVLEAVHLSKQLGVPVKLTWSREDSLTQGPVRPGMLNVLRGGLDANGKVTTLQHKVVGASLLWQNFKVAPEKDRVWAEGVSQKDSPYDIPNRQQNFVLAETDIPILWWRSVYASTNVFGHECFIDELAHSAGKDPMQFRLDMLKDSARQTAVLNLLKSKANYGQKLPAGQAIGIAISRAFESICAYAITVSKQGKGVKIEKVVGVIDCGIAVNPNQVKAQTEGNVVMALSTALKAPITIADGEIVETNFHLFNPLRINETPNIEIHIVENELEPTGVGEPGLPPVAPALCNAIFNLTKIRIRKLPFDLGNIV